MQITFTSSQDLFALATEQFCYTFDISLFPPSHQSKATSSMAKRSFMSKDYKIPSITHSYSEYERDGTDISVVGSLRAHRSYWTKFQTPPHILNIVNNGYTIPLTKLPPRRWLPNNKTSREEPQFVQREIDDLITKGAVVEVDSPPHVTNPLTVSRKNDKLRLVLDLRHVNPYVYLKKCKIEGPETLAKFIYDSDHLYGFDLKSGYHHVDIISVQHTLLGFSYKDYSGRTRFFQYVVMPFGLNSAGFIFTRILRVLIKHWRTQQLKILAFFDDGIGSAQGYYQALLHSNIVKTDLVLAGWIPNTSKSHWIPSNFLVWLGFA